MYLNIETMDSSLAEIGKIKIGGKGDTRKSRAGADYRMPVQLNNFLVTGTERDSNGDLLPDKAVMEIIGNTKELQVFLMFDEIELNFPNYFSMYKGKKMFCSGNGIDAERIDEKTGAVTKMQCSCPFLEQKKCKPTGRLSVVLREAQRTGGVYVFRTHGWNSVKNIKNSLAFIHSLTGGILSGIPLILKLGKKTVTHEAGTANVNVVTIEYDGNMTQLMSSALAITEARSMSKIGIAKMKQIEASRLLQLSSPETFDTDNPADVLEEYYPEEQEGYQPEKGFKNPVTGNTVKDTAPAGTKKMINGLIEVKQPNGDWLPEDAHNNIYAETGRTVVIDEIAEAEAEQTQPLEAGDNTIAEIAVKALKNKNQEVLKLF